MLGMTKVSEFPKMFGIPENLMKPNARRFNIHFVECRHSF